MHLYTYVPFLKDVNFGNFTVCLLVIVEKKQWLNETMYFNLIIKINHEDPAELFAK